MLNTFKYTVLSLTRVRSVLFWTLAFPIILGTIFFAMFSNIDSSNDFEPIPIAVINDSNYQDEAAFRQLVDTLSETGENQMLVPSFVKEETAAKELLKDQSVVGYYKIETDGKPKLYTAVGSGADFSTSINQTILKNLLDNYIHKSSTINTLMEENPLTLMDPAFTENLYEQNSYTNEISITANKASGSIRYFYSLLGFASIMAAMIGMTAIVRTQANLSALGARRAIGATARAKTLVATLVAAWLVSYICLLIGYCYLSFVLGINFGRDALSILGLGIASFMATGLGACIGTIPKLPEGTKIGILTGLTCLVSLFAGLYGEPAMELADNLARNAPIIQMLNPARLVTELFYSLYYFDGYEQFITTSLFLVAYGLVLLFIAATFMRRQRYASL